MMSSNKKYWKSVAELHGEQTGDPIIQDLKQNEFIQEIPVDEFLSDQNSLEDSQASRRDFLKYIGFSTAAASLAACEGPVKKSIPYVVQPEQIVPGVANYYATTIADGFDYASILVKTREGRPIKIERNLLAQAGGSVNARVHASILSLYDNSRIKVPSKNGKSISWSNLDAEITTKFANIADKSIVFLTQTLASPSTAKIITSFQQKFPNTQHIQYDAISCSEALDAFQRVFGKRALPNYDFSKATTIVGIGADFLGDWQGGGYDVGYAKGRIPKQGKMSKHIHFESNMTLSGANADERIAIKPSDQWKVLASLYTLITGSGSRVTLQPELNRIVNATAKQIKKAGANAVVISGIEDVDAQLLVLAINTHLSSKAFQTDNPRTIRQGSTKQLNQLIKAMQAGKVGALVISGVNPVYSLPNSTEFVAGLKKVDLSIAFSTHKDETASLCNYIAAASHFLESWGDVELDKGSFSFSQPTIRTLFDTSQFQQKLLDWTGEKIKYRDYLKTYWETKTGLFSWNKILQDGVWVDKETEKSTNLDTPVAEEIGAPILAADEMLAAARRLANVKFNGLELALYTKTAMGDGAHANNPWLQELPDPITRTSWDNYLTISRTDAEKLGLKNENVANGALNGSYVKVSVQNQSVVVPVIIQPGQAEGSVGLALGYGKKQGLKKEMQVGQNAYPLYHNFSSIQSATVQLVDGMHEFACVQLHNTLMGRGDIVKETTLEIFNSKDKKFWNPIAEVTKDHEFIPVTSPEVDLWDAFDRTVGHHFNLSIDLNACTGCGACVIACHAENNVPVVGKSEIRRSRDMHWLRIDRYYSSEENFVGDNKKKDEISGLGSSLSEFGEMENPSDNPQVVFQPVMCQHCNHAPCETVCPVAATSHGRQGQNHMAYNRCVGTRYCANNCPYKVRRFNWFLYNNNDEFDYHMNNDLGRMVINPDVTVRSRGVMEKCSMCIQKTQKTILDAKREGRLIQDGEFQTACSSACETGAMVFGDVNDKKSKVAELTKDKRMYHLLEHVGTKPNVMYHTKIRNTSEA